MEVTNLIQELCKNLEKDLNNLNPYGGKRTVEFISQLSPSNFLPQNKTIETLRDESGRFEMMWLVQIKIDNKTVFQHSYIPRESEDLKIVEGMMLNRILNHIFSYGVMSAHNNPIVNPTA
jgi:hypothetical protein